MVFDKDFLDQLLEKASVSERLRQNFDLRNSPDDTSQRMLNALQPGTVVPIHNHADTAETVICLSGKLEEIFYKTSDADNSMFEEVSRHLLCPNEGKYGMQITAGVWHSINVIEPSVIFEAKDGAYKG
ncbi:WbuC family cupin fold metalloprotein [uncultured Bacteroides sp.]|uniref:WbuC family cupin fold metalloprotein n=1 Tax=uncultured Bacteroides sp. TaxID=162156 RepID=UPI002609530A|nr:WbuC family cupin fold metalloprotein [uncultured Bacteroides sp.]